MHMDDHVTTDHMVMSSNGHAHGWSPQNRAINGHRWSCRNQSQIAEDLRTKSGTKQI